jgi:surfactin synthase thioesterase subunit
MAFVLPILRADFQACDTYACAAEPPLEIPFYLYGGDDDSEVRGAELEQWRQHTSAPFRLQMFAGSHFFVHAQRDALVADIARQLAALHV